MKDIIKSFDDYFPSRKKTILHRHINLEPITISSYEWIIRIRKYNSGIVRLKYVCSTSKSSYKRNATSDKNRRSYCIFNIAVWTDKWKIVWSDGKAHTFSSSQYSTISNAMGEPEVIQKRLGISSSSDNIKDMHFERGAIGIPPYWVPIIIGKWLVQKRDQLLMSFKHLKSLKRWNLSVMISWKQ